MSICLVYLKTEAFQGFSDGHLLFLVESFFSKSADVNKEFDDLVGGADSCFQDLIEQIFLLFLIPTFDPVYTSLFQLFLTVAPVLELVALRCNFDMGFSKGRVFIVWIDCWAPQD